MDLKLAEFQEFPGEPVVRLHTLTAKGTASIPDQGTKIQQAVGSSQ